MINYEQQLAKMYAEDIEKMQAEIAELKKERDLWKNRCLESEATVARASRSLRHV
jgi:hypothetical protein